MKRHLDIGIGLIVLQHGIILRPVLFDQITFQYQCFQFRVRDDILKPADFRYHLFNFCRFIPAALEILPYPVFQAYGFSHIDDLVFFIMH